MIIVITIIIIIIIIIINWLIKYIFILPYSFI